MTIEFGLVVPFGPPKNDYGKWLADVDASATLLENHFSSLWMTDHFFWDDKPIFEAWTTMSFMAARFPKYKIGPMVLGQNYRNPAMLALMAATLQTVSEGRFIMSIGAGWKEDEYLAYDYVFPTAGTRIEQLEDTLNIFKKLWTDSGQVNYEGKHYKVVNAWCEPKPKPMIPILVGAGGEKSLRLVAKYADIWNWGLCDVGTYSERLDILKQHCQDLGRDISTLRLSWFGSMAIGRSEQDAKKYAKDLYWGNESALVGTPEQIATQMTEFIELGVDYFMLVIPSLPNQEIANLITQELLPRIRDL